MKKVLLSFLSVIMLACTLPAFADELKVSKIELVLFEQPTDILLNIDNLTGDSFVRSPTIEIFDYGGEIYKQVNSNKLTYKESNVFTANFAKEQNQNFERMYLNS